MKIADVEAFPCSFPTAPDAQVKLGIGTTVKRDAVVVKVTTEEGLIGWGESHHGRSPGAVARLIQTTLRDVVIGCDANDVVGIWSDIYRLQLASHGLGAAAAIGMSGIDMALWDIRGKACGWPLYRLLGGSKHPMPAYAGGISLGYAPVGALLEEVQSYVDRGFGAVKLRIGDRPDRDLERVSAVRAEFPDVAIMTDVNAAYTLDEVRMLMPGLQDSAVAWLEEPFPAHDYRSYAAAATLGSVPLAAGENHYTRYEFSRLIEDRVVRILQPDLSKTGGITEVLRIAALGSAWRLPVNPHTSTTGINMAATVHLLASVENAGYYESDVSRDNLFRDQLVISDNHIVSAEGTVQPSDQPGLGVSVDEDFLKAHPVIDGAGYV